LEKKPKIPTPGPIRFSENHTAQVQLYNEFNILATDVLEVG
jgi:hypothetical protein